MRIWEELPMIEYLNLSKINKPYINEFKSSLNVFYENGYYINGENVKSFEKNLCDYIGSEYASGCSNGLDALKLIFKAYLEIGKLKVGDEILVPSNTYIASILALSDLGLKPRLIEPDINTYNISGDIVEKNISEKTKGILIVHLYGRICWDEKLELIKKSNQIIIVEDNAQSIGAKYKNKKSGNLGHAAAFSFYPTKNLGALGDAGAVTTDDYEIYQLCYSLSNYGSHKKYTNNLKGYNARLDEIQAIFLNVKIKKIDNVNAKRKRVAKKFCNLLNNKKLILPNYPQTEEENVWHIFPIRVSDRKSFIDFLESKNVQFLIHYPIPIHKQKAYRELNHEKHPIAEKISREIISIPCNQSMMDNEINRLIDILNTY